MNDFRYALIRFIADSNRMEPTNVGVILQGMGKIDFKLSPHFAKRKEIDTAVYKQWREFFVEEIRGEPMPLFQPPKNSEKFLHHLANLCDETVSISRPLVRQCHENHSFDHVMIELFDRLVASPEIEKKDQNRPTSKFRDIEKERDFEKRGIKKNAYVATGGTHRWNAYRQVLNGKVIVIDQIEIGSKVGTTAGEIQKLSMGIDEFLPGFLQSSRFEYFLIADEFKEKFTDQLPEDFALMQDELNQVIETVHSHRGKVLRSTGEVLEFGNYVDEKLPSLETMARIKIDSRV